MHLVFAAMQDELIWVGQSNLAQLAVNRLGWVLVRRLLWSAASLARVTLECFYSLVVELVLESESATIAWLKMLLPALVDSAREHKRHLRDLCEVVLLVFDDTDDVLLAAFAERKLWAGIVRAKLCKLLLP